MKSALHSKSFKSLMYILLGLSHMGPTWLMLNTSEGRPEAQNRIPSIHHQLFICPFIKGASLGEFDIRIKPYVQPSLGTIWVSSSDGTRRWLNIRFSPSIESSWGCPLYKGTNKQLVDWKRQPCNSAHPNPIRCLT